MVLRTSYAVYSTDLAYAATSFILSALLPAPSVSCPICLSACYAMSGTDTAICLRACYAMSSTETAISLRACYAMSSTDTAICLRACYAMSGTDTCIVLSADAHATRCPVLRWRCYAMSGTELAYAGTHLPTRARAHASMGSAIFLSTGALSAYELLCDARNILRALQLVYVDKVICLHACYAMSGNEQAKAGTHLPTGLLRDVRC
eukprot:3940555-Rhodomonas_salina.1